MSQSQSPTYHLLVATSENYTEVYNFFRRSLENTPNIQVHVHTIDMSKFPVIRFQSDGWYHACREKLQFVLRFMVNNAHIDHMIVSDADIQFFRPHMLPLLVEEACNRGLDYFGMQEGARSQTQTAYNGGFYVLKNTSAMQDFFRFIIDKLISERPPLADQSLINSILFGANIYKLRHAFIPPDRYVWGEGDPSDPGPRAIFHHAVCTINCQDKVDQMTRVWTRYISRENHINE